MERLGLGRFICGIAAMNILCICTIIARVADADEALNETAPLTFEYRVDSLTFTSASGKVLLVSNHARRVALFDLVARQVLRELSYDRIAPALDFHDVAVARNGSVAYLVGTALGGGGGILVRLDLETFSEQTVRFVEEFILSTVAVDDTGQIFVTGVGEAGSSGAVGNSIIMRVSDRLFKQGDARIIAGGLPTNVYLKYGPAADLGSFERGEFVVASHALTRTVSLVNIETSEVVDEVGPGGLAGTTLALATAARPFESVIVADNDERLLLVYDVDPHFQAFRYVGSARLLGLGELARHQVEDQPIRSPLIVSADREQRVIVVGRRDHNQIALFKRTGPATLERVNVVPLEETISDIDVSPDGNILAILNTAGTGLKVGANGPTLQFITDPKEWAALAGRAIGVEEIREAQRLLSDLRYPIKVVDGYEGPDTKRIVSVFQETVGLEPTGVLDRPTRERIREVAAEDDNPAACSRVPEANRCSKGAIEMYPRLGSKEIEGAICRSTADGSRTVQLDRYGTLQEEARGYVCTTYHSCAFIRFGYLEAYDKLCR